MYIFRDGKVLNFSYDSEIRLDQYGFYINKGGKNNNFVEDILNGKKTIETRTINSSHIIDNCVKVGDKVAIITNGEIVGTATIAEEIHYKNKEDFKKDYNKHLVDADDKEYGWKEGKVGYRLANIKRMKPKKVPKADHPMGIRKIPK